MFNTFHGGSTGTWETAERRAHAYLGAAPTGAVGHLLLGQMLGGNDSSEDDSSGGDSSEGEHGHGHEDADGSGGGGAGGGDVEEANKWLALVPSRQKLQSAVPYPIELVCKVDRKTGREYDPFPGHNK